MDESRKAVLEDLAGMLSASWRDPANKVAVDPRFYPRNRTEAYFVQDRMHDELGQGLAGRIVGEYLDSLATLNIPSWGYGLRYEYGLF